VARGKSFLKMNQRAMPIASQEGKQVKMFIGGFPFSYLLGTLGLGTFGLAAFGAFAGWGVCVGAGVRAGVLVDVGL